MKPYQIRQARWADCEAIASVHVKAWQESYVDIISVLKENTSACHFYEKQGGQFLKGETVCIDDRSYPENVYIFY